MKKIGLYIMMVSCSLNPVNVLASNEIAAQIGADGEVMLIDLLLQPYLEKIEDYNQKNAENFTVEENDKWLFWCANYKDGYEHFDSVLNSMSEELSTEEYSTTSENENFPTIMYSAPDNEEDDIMQNTLQELLVPYQHGVEVVNYTEDSDFEIPTELEWNFLYYFSDMDDNEFIDYLNEERAQLKETSKNDLAKKTKIFLRNTVKSAKTERDEIFLNYQTIIDRVQKEQDVSIVFSDDEKWLATITFEHFSPDELYNYLTEQF